MTEPNTSMKIPRASQAQEQSRRRVTDAPTRMFHWLFAFSFTGAYLTADIERWRQLHVKLGYVFVALLGFRVLYGLIGPRQVRLALLGRKLEAGRHWLKSLRNPRALTWAHIQQFPNIVMTASIATMMLVVVPLTLSGHAVFNDWGGELMNDWMEELHEFFGNASLVAVLAHLSAIGLWLLLRRSSRVAPMLTGFIPGGGPSPVRYNQEWLAVALLLGSIGLGYWLW